MIEELKELESSKTFKDYKTGDMLLFCKAKSKNGSNLLLFISLENQKHWNIALNTIQNKDGEWYWIVKGWYEKPITKQKALIMAEKAMYKTKTNLRRI